MSPKKRKHVNPELVNHRIKLSALWKSRFFRDKYYEVKKNLYCC